MDIYAHRGNSGEAPENTLEAFRQAIAIGADGVEFDVQLTKDGVPVVIHDETVNRTTDGVGAVQDLTLQQIQALDAGKWLAAKYSGERIPTLEAVLALLKDSGLRINIELKTNRVPYPGIARATIELVRKHGLERRVQISSFNHQTLREARQTAPDLEYAVLTADQMLEPWTYVKHYGFQGFHPGGYAVSEEVVRRCHDSGLKVRVWTVDDPKHAEEFARIGIDALITNHPRRFIGRFR